MSCDYVLLHGKNDFADMIKDPEGEVLLDYPGRPNVITRFLIRQREGEESQESDRDLQMLFCWL